MTSPPKDKLFQVLLSALVVSSGLLYGLLTPQYQTGVYNDDAVNVIVAQDLWNKSKTQPLLHLRPDYPMPGVPLFLAPVAKVVRPHWVILEWMSVIVTMASVFLLGLWAKKWLSAGETLAVVGLYAFNPIVARFSGILMPAPYYTIAVISSFFLMSELLGKPTAAKALGLGFVLGWGSLVRPEGVLLLISVAGPLLVSRRRKEFAGALMISLMGWLFFAFFWIRSRHFAAMEYGGDLSALVSLWTHHFSSAVRFFIDFMHVFLIRTLTTFDLPAHFWGEVLRVALIVLCMGGIAAGIRSLWREQPHKRMELVSVGLFGLSYLMIHLYWHVAIRRYAIPLLPFVLLFLVHAVSERVFPMKRRTWWTALVLLPLLSLYGMRHAFAIHEALWAPDPMKSPPWRSLEWLEANTQTSDKMISTIAPSLFLYANRFAIQRITTHHIERFLYIALQKQCGYIVDRNTRFLTTGAGAALDPNVSWTRLRYWIRQYPQRFTAAFSDPDEQTVIYKINYAPGFQNAYEKYTAAVAQFKAGQFDSSWQTLRDALSFYPRLASAVNLLGLHYVMRNDFSNAERAFLKATELVPDSTTAVLNLAILYHRLGQQGRVEECLRAGRDMSTLHGEQTKYAEKVQQLQKRWINGGKDILFIDMP